MNRTSCSKHQLQIEKQADSVTQTTATVIILYRMVEYVCDYVVVSFSLTDNQYEKVS